MSKMERRKFRRRMNRRNKREDIRTLYWVIGAVILTAVIF